MHYLINLKTPFIISSLILMACISCSKDEDTNINNEPEQKSFRVKQSYLLDENGTKIQYQTFSYEDDKLGTVETYRIENGLWTIQYKTQVNYDGNQVCIIETDADGFEHSIRHTFTFEGENIATESYWNITSSPWTECKKLTYQYKNDNLSSFYFHEINGITEKDLKGEYIYQDTELQQIKYSFLDSDDQWYENLKWTFTYSGDCITECTEYYFGIDDDWEYLTDREWKNIYKGVYSYVENNVSDIQWFYYDEDSEQWELEYIMKYNSNACLTEIQIGYNQNFYYEYEEGIGNEDELGFIIDTEYIFFRYIIGGF
ncbi:hypothetical protein [Saccharicrinis sp. 156]|uniref:hypothetical protein n=1 Tax=Saccharicrinis sp. 156 TaxID=3417574 RepID=UPI003D33C2DC